MKILFDFKYKYPSIELATKKKSIIIRYWGKLKFDKVCMYSEEREESEGRE